MSALALTHPPSPPLILHLENTHIFRAMCYRTVYTNHPSATATISHTVIHRSNPQITFHAESFPCDDFERVRTHCYNIICLCRYLLYVCMYINIYIHICVVIKKK